MFIETIVTVFVLYSCVMYLYMSLIFGPVVNDLRRGCHVPKLEMKSSKGGKVCSSVIMGYF